MKKGMIADLHIHSRFSRACSKDLNIPNLVKWARIKGLDLLGTGDFTHPIWLQELKNNLKEKNNLYYYDGFPFIITGEVSLIYTQERGRKVHLLLLVPNFEIADKINSYLDTKGRRDYDGRPIFNISCRDFTKEMMKISKDIEIIPAHIWTPYFGVLGSISGFNSLKEAFHDQVENIHAIETGISSDPKMNVRVKELSKKAIVSFSDAHSFWPYRLGREATIFKKTDSYLGIINQIRNNSFIGTIETDPAYGKYHYDGHRLCNFSSSPQETKKLNKICPVCKNPLTLGVSYRVEDLADPGNSELKTKKYYTLLPLHELLSLMLRTGMHSKKVWQVYNELIQKFKNEFEILIFASKEDMVEKRLDKNLIEIIIKNREGNIKVKPGFDGVYGKAIFDFENLEPLDKDSENKSKTFQKTLF